MPGLHRATSRRWPAIVGLGVVAIVVANVLRYVRTTANPLVASDGWYFVSGFVGKALDGTAGLADLFAKRAGLDHAQPLHKLFLYVDARYFGLDFMHEGFVGLAFAVAGLVLLVRAARVHWRGHTDAWAFWAPVAAMAAVYLSLNSSMLFTWPLVTFGFVTNAFLFAAMYAAWLAYRGQLRIPAFVLVAVGAVLVADDVSVLLSAALAASLVLAGGKDRRLGKAALVAALPLAVTLAYLVAYRWLVTLDGSTAAHAIGLSARLDGLARAFQVDGWKWLVIPLASSVAYAGQLANYFPRHWEAVQVGLAVLVALGHGWFWSTALRRPNSAPLFIAVSLMLLAYAYVAGIIFGRVAEQGSGYLNEPRYVTFYQLGLVALLLMTLSDAGPRGRPAAARGRVALAVALLVLQLPLSWYSWTEAGFSRQYWQTMAVQIGSMARRPGEVPRNCVPMLVLCQWSPDRREAALLLLRRHRLNLFSPDFQRRHDLAP